MITAIIPSRFGSTRFFGKPLQLLAGKSMIQRVYEQAEKSSLVTQVAVATDDERIDRAVKKFGALSVMTPSEIRSGTDRVAKASDILGLAPDDIVINIQGDQPVFNPQCLDELTEPLRADPGLGMSTLAFKIKNKREITDPKDVKVVFDNNGFALYFSRSSIPFPRDTVTDSVYYKHLGFYAYRKNFLDKIASLETGLLENTEKLEQLRVLEYGFKIKVVVTEHDSPEVDLPEDIARIEKVIAAMETFPDTVLPAEKSLKKVHFK